MISETGRKTDSGPMAGSAQNPQDSQKPQKPDSAQAGPRKDRELRHDTAGGGGKNPPSVSRTGQKPGSAPQAPPDATLYRVCWASVFSAACGAGDPMSRDLAEFRAENEAVDHPFRRYWLEVYRSGGSSGLPTIRH